MRGSLRAQLEPPRLTLMHVRNHRLVVVPYDVCAVALAKDVELGDGRRWSKVARERLATPRSLHEKDGLARTECVVHSKTESELRANEVGRPPRAKPDGQVAKGRVARQRRDDGPIYTSLSAVLVKPDLDVGKNGPVLSCIIPEGRKKRGRARIGKLIGLWRATWLTFNRRIATGPPADSPACH